MTHWSYHNARLYIPSQQKDAIILYVYLHLQKLNIIGLWVMVFNATFNNISAISWLSVLWWRKQECPKKTTDLPHVTDKLYHISCIEYPSQYAVFELTTLVVIDADCTGSCKFNYHTITTATAPSSIIISSCC